MNFFVKYKLQINIVLLIFWIFIIYENYTSGDFKLIRIAPAILFIILSLYNIYRSIKPNNSKSED
jgi:hypothetical protein